MPVVTVFKLNFLRDIGNPQKDTDDAATVDKNFFQLCFDMGLELDGITSDRIEAAKSKEGAEAFTLADEDPALIQYKIEVAANRYDLLCHSGLVRAFRFYLGHETPKSWTATTGTLQMNVDASVEAIRPIVLCGVLRNIKFTGDLYNEFIQLQDKLHANVCRRRKLVSVGTHDLDKIKGPFLYRAVDPSSFSFVPLERGWMSDDVKGHKYSGADLMPLLDENDKALRPYLHLIRESPVYPVITDSTGEVLSLPPIINGDYSKMSEATRNVLVEVTAIDATKAHIVLNTILTMFAAHAESIETVTVGGQVTPDLSEREHISDIGYINSVLGLQLTAEQICALLCKMGLVATPVEGDSTKLRVMVPVTRSDVMHDCDIAEDVGIAYGYNKLKPSGKMIVSEGCQNPLNALCDQLRAELAHAGYAEVLTESLVSRKENFEMLGREDTGNNALSLDNPKTKEFEIGRTSLLPCLLKCLRTNNAAKLPIRLMEVSDVMLIDESTNEGVRNERRAMVVCCDRAATFEQVHGVLDKVFELMSLKDGYTLKAVDADPALFTGRQAVIHRNDTGAPVGSIGIVHPRALTNYNIKNPVGVFELTVKALL